MESGLSKLPLAGKFHEGVRAGVVALSELQTKLETILDGTGIFSTVFGGRYPEHHLNKFGKPCLQGFDLTSQSGRLFCQRVDDNYFWLSGFQNKRE